MNDIDKDKDVNDMSNIMMVGHVVIKDVTSDKILYSGRGIENTDSNSLNKYTDNNSMDLTKDD